MRFVNLTQMLGEKILRENDIAFASVLQVDMGVNYKGLCPTCAYIDYEVAVYFQTADLDRLRYIKSYDYMSTIIKELEDLEDEV